VKTRKKVIFAKIEQTYGVDPTPAGTDAILTSGLQRSLYEGNVISRDNDRATLGAETTINTGPNVVIEFSVELAGSGTAGTAPAYDVLLRACGFEPTVDAGVDVTYTPRSSGFESCTIYYQRDGERQVATGCRGTVTFDFSIGGYPKMNFRLVGKYAKPSAQSDILADITDFEDPLPVNYANTGTFTLDSYNLILQSLNVGMNAETPYMNMVNLEEVFYVDRSPSGQISFLAPTIAQKDIMALVESHAGTITTSVMQLVHGSTGGNIIQLDAPAVQLSGLSEVDISGEQGYQSDAIFVPTGAGDNEVTLVVK